MRGHTKSELTTSMRDKSEHVRHVGHDGAPERGPRRDGMTLHSHPASVGNVAGQTDHTNVKLALGKTPQPKRAFTEKIAIHAGTINQTRVGGEAFGGDHSLTGVSVVPGKDGTAPCHPLTTPPVAKNYSRVQPSPGMRSRTLDGPTDGVGVAHARAQASNYHSDMAELTKRIFDEAIGPSPSGHVRGRK